MKQAQIPLPIDDLPRNWYNIIPDLQERLPSPKDPEEGPSHIAALGKRLVGECLRQESSDSRWINIPEEVRELYIQAGRPRPLYRAYRLEGKLGLRNVRIYYKRGPEPHRFPQSEHGARPSLLCCQGGKESVSH